MMTMKRTTYRWWWSCLMTGGLLLAGCADNDEQSEQGVMSEGTSLELQSVTRTGDAYRIPSTDSPASPDIRLFLTTTTSDNVDKGIYQYDSFDKRWKSNDIKIKEEAQYYMYGYMPNAVGSDTITKPAGEGKTFADGADITLSGLPSVTSQDICVIVGVQKAPRTSLNETPSVREGNYGYFSGIKGDNYVNLLMDHLYSAIELSFKIDADYAKLRSIHLKTVTLVSKFGSVSATVELRPEQGIGTPSFTKAADADEDGDPVVMLNATSLEDELVLDKTHTSTALTLENLAYCAPCIFGATPTNLTLTTVYDVYDKENKNLGVRTSVNAIDIVAIPSGQKRKLTLTVNPSYLYILSNWDIDNPEFVITE